MPTREGRPNADASLARARSARTGPLVGLRVIELAGIGPAPFCAMLLADIGAEVVRIDRTEAVDLGTRLDRRFNLMTRGRRSVAVDLKHPEGLLAVRRLIDRADVLIEGFRPGVVERLGLGPEDCLARNRRLVYGRVTGWGQDGPLAHAAGHDINYLSLAGALSLIGPKQGPPVIPLNLVGDYGGGALYLALGILAAVIEARTSGLGQVVDAAMIDGVASLLAGVFSHVAAGSWVAQRGSNILDGGAPWYGVYETADRRFVAVGAVEPKFYAELVRRLGLDARELPAQHDQEGWPMLREAFARTFKTKTRAEWCALLEGTDACVTPVLELGEVADHPHNRTRGTFAVIDGMLQAPAVPRFGRTKASPSSGPVEPGRDSDQVLTDWGFTSAEVDTLREARAIR